MTMLGEPGTEIMVYPVHFRMEAIMVRRRDVTETDYVAFFSANTKTLRRLPVKTADGRDAKAVGLEITLDGGNTFRAIVNYEPEDMEVVLGELRTKERFATDYTD